MEHAIYVHNIGDRPRKVTLPGQDGWAEVIDLLGTDDRKPGDNITIDPQGIQRLRVGIANEPVAH